ncbi:MAG TPA: hypothetical protein VGS17_12195 [Candidatus Limnocylindria bacterium]|nr:hypothetical protein [Candidatus Limnocylindria bacterium]
MTMDRARATAIGLAIATLALAVAGVALGGGTLGGVNGTDRSAAPGDVFELVSLLATAVVGLVVALRRPGNPIGWIFSWLALITAIYLAAGGYAIHDAVVSPGSLPGGEWAAWFRNWADRSTAALVLLAFLLFPTGRLASPRWRFGLALPPLVAVGFAARAFVPGLMDFLGLPNPLGLAWVPQSIDDGGTGGMPLVVGTFVAFAQLATRFRAAGGAEREQIKWLALPVVALIVALITTIATLASGVSQRDEVNGTVISALYALVGLLLPICMGIAVLRHRLFDIDILINRALVYGATTAAIAVAFFAGIVILQAILRPLTSGSELAVAASTLACFALFQPLRARVQNAVDRRFYRSRYDAARTLDAFSVRLRDEVDLDAVRADLVDAVRDTVQPAHASVWLRR